MLDWREPAGGTSIITQRKLQPRLTDSGRHSAGCYTFGVMTRTTDRLASLFVFMSCALLFAVPIEYHPVLFIFAALVGHVGLVRSLHSKAMELPAAGRLPIVG